MVDLADQQGNDASRTEFDDQIDDAIQLLIDDPDTFAVLTGTRNGGNDRLSVQTYFGSDPDEINAFGQAQLFLLANHLVALANGFGMSTDALISDLRMLATQYATDGEVSTTYHGHYHDDTDL